MNKSVTAPLAVIRPPRWLIQVKAPQTKIINRVVFERKQHIIFVGDINLTFKAFSPPIAPLALQPRVAINVHT